MLNVIEHCKPFSFFSYLSTNSIMRHKRNFIKWSIFEKSRKVFKIDHAYVPQSRHLADLTGNARLVYHKQIQSFVSKAFDM